MFYHTSAIFESDVWYLHRGFIVFSQEFVCRGLHNKKSHGDNFDSKGQFIETDEDLSSDALDEYIFGNYEDKCKFTSILDFIDDL